MQMHIAIEMNDDSTIILALSEDVEKVMKIVTDYIEETGGWDVWQSDYNVESLRTSGSGVKCEVGAQDHVGVVYSKFDPETERYVSDIVVLERETD